MYYEINISHAKSLPGATLSVCRPTFFIKSFAKKSEMNVPLLLMLSVVFMNSRL